jgi:hypothetical protein
LNPASLSDGCSPLYLYEWANEAIIANRASIEIDRLHNGDVLSKLGIDNPGMPDRWPDRFGLFQ